MLGHFSCAAAFVLVSDITYVLLANNRGGAAKVDGIKAKLLIRRQCWSLPSPDSTCTTFQGCICTHLFRRDYQLLHSAQ